MCRGALTKLFLQIKIYNVVWQEGVAKLHRNTSNCRRNQVEQYGSTEFTAEFFTPAKSLLTIAKAKSLARKTKLHRQNYQKALIKQGQSHHFRSFSSRGIACLHSHTLDQLLLPKLHTVFQLKQLLQEFSLSHQKRGFFSSQSLSD